MGSLTSSGIGIRRFSPIRVIVAALLLVLLAGPRGRAQSTVDFEQLFDGAEAKFVVPEESWFLETQAQLRAEMEHVSAALEAEGGDYATLWKEHFRWNLLDQNLVPLEKINLDEIELARRWLFSNRKGTEHALFAQLRTDCVAYLDAAYTLSQPDLDKQFAAHVALARQQCRNLANDPSDHHAASLGRTLGWLERTCQLPSETAAIRAAMSHPNLQLVVSDSLVRKIMSTQDAKIDHTLPVSDQGETPPTRRFQIPRTVYVRGTAHTVGEIALELVPNPRLAQLSIVYHGTVESHCHANAGPLSFDMRTVGPVEASKSVNFDMSEIELGITTVTPKVRTSVTGISAQSNFVRRAGERRIQDPEAHAFMSARARNKTTQLLKSEMDERVETAVAEIRAEITRLRSNMGQFSEVFAPLVREGAAPFIAGTASTGNSIALNVRDERREQFGASTICPFEIPASDLQLRIHSSFLNNMLETIMSGKTFTDEYFMKYAKVLQPTLPLDLMVHSRAPRWAIIADQPRPFQLRIPAPNELEITLHIAALELAGVRYREPTTAVVRYQLVQNEFEEIYLKRAGDVVLDSSLTADQQQVLQNKLSAFFAPVLDGGGVMIPDGEGVGAINLLQFAGFRAEQNWIAAGWKVPQEFVDRLMRGGTEADADVAPESELPPPFSLDDELGTYPAIP